MARISIFFLSILLILSSCTPTDPEENPQPNPNPDPVEETYFPPSGSNSWETISPDSLGWEASKLQELYSFLETNNSRAFIILKSGKIVVEKYWGNNIANTAPFTQNSQWYWASAGKTLTSFLVGLAQQQDLLDIEDKSSDYLGEGWTSLTRDKEELITIRHQLTMTTGLDYEVPDVDCTDPGCLQYKADPGTQWFYHNAPYTLLERVVSQAAGIAYNQYTDEQLEQKIGMSGNWFASGFNNVYWSKPRDMARFGWLIMNGGNWDGDQIMTDSVFFEDMISTSQDLNPSYGYLWWLNGKGSIIFPGQPNKFPLSLAPNAPAELFAAMGKNGQFIDLLPSQELVVVRMGESPDASLVPAIFHNDMWEKISDLID